MSDSEDDEAEAAEFMSQPEINDFLEEAEEEKEQLAGRSGKHWKPMVFEEVFEVAETTHFPSGFQPRTRTIPQERFLRPAAVFDTVYGDNHDEPTTLKQAKMCQKGTLRLVGLIVLRCFNFETQ
jgi:hypothetical protein